MYVLLIMNILYADQLIHTVDILHNYCCRQNIFVHTVKRHLLLLMFLAVYTVSPMPVVQSTNTTYPNPIA